ncbi:MAG: ABC-ATPase domain-containing protein [Lachnospiraceae bacterium]|nr:ABC-ATPase domain-containing protein [Lachnospiraceae bacterium]
MRQLDEILRRIDHRPYPAYKDLRGSYRFPKYTLHIDHVQGDPFAAPSSLRLEIPSQTHKLPPEHYANAHRRIMAQDYLLRKFAFQLRNFSKKAGGSGKSGVMDVTRPHQEVLDRSALQIDSKTGVISVRFHAGFPAAGRTTLAGELRKMLFEYLTAAVDKSLAGPAIKQQELASWIALSDDQQAIRDALPGMGLVAFVGNGAILPRKSGVQDSPMLDAVPFKTPKEDEVEISLPGNRKIKGMGVRQGITLIVGGGYHGKSTMLKALERGVYNHIPGDGREYVITEDTACKLRAEDGRSIMDIDISPFIRDLPSKRDTVNFSTEDASGSTSQAAAVVEAYLSGGKTFLIDEDTSATNFLVRDALMASVVHRDKEPIIPFLDRMKELSAMGISIVLVAGSSGAFFNVADNVIQMDEYVPVNITEKAWQAVGRSTESADNKLMSTENPEASVPSLRFRADPRIPLPNRELLTDRRVKVRASGTDNVSINHESVEVRFVEQLIDNEQTNLLAQLLKELQTKVFDGKTPLSACLEKTYERLLKNGFSAFFRAEDMPANLAMARKQELFAMVNRTRNIKLT